MRIKGPASADSKKYLARGDQQNRDWYQLYVLSLSIFEVFLAIARFSLIIPDQLEKTNRLLPNPCMVCFISYEKLSVSLFNFVGPYLQGYLTVVFIQKQKCIIPLGTDQPVFLAQKASEEAHLVEPLAHTHQVVSGAW